jgi:hypothetical protein
MKTKKLLISLGATLVLGVGAYLNLQQVQTQQEVSDLTLANLEAMAFDLPFLERPGFGYSYVQKTTSQIGDSTHTIITCKGQGTLSCS